VGLKKPPQKPFGSIPKEADGDVVELPSDMKFDIALTHGLTARVAAH
jgi:hypothetical protein